MTNNFKLFLSILFISTIFLTTTQAATITWLGANASWNNPAQWDTGTIPVMGDDVVIPSGTVRVNSGYNATATSVEVQSAARLLIYDGGKLEISGAVDNDGLHNTGRVYLYGDLFINGITQTNIAFSAKAIKNENRIYTYPSSQINIKYIDDDAFYNTPTGYFYGRGGIWIYSVSKRGIYNGDRFYTSGTIDIEETGASNSFAIVNSDDFRNLSGGVITIDADIYGGFSNAVSPAWTRNYGEIFIEHPSIGVVNEGTFRNFSGGTVTVENSGVGYDNRSGGLFSNYGYMSTFYCVDGMYNWATLENYSGMYFYLSSGNNGSLRNFSGGLIDNYGSIYANGSGSRDIQNQGQINNHHGGIVSVNRLIDINPTGVLVNDGFLVSYYEGDVGNHIIAVGGTLDNNGVIDDNYGTFPTALNNQKVIVSPVTDPMHNGVPFPNVLDITSTAGLTFGNWKISQTGAVAGTYDEVTNEFTPNAAAIGITTIYIEIEDDVSGFNRNFTLEIDGGVLPFSGNKPNNAMISPGNLPRYPG